MLASAPLLGREHAGAAETVRVHFHQAHAIAYLVEPPGIVILRLLPARADWKDHL
jgi:plasmid stabilization system protein ParE